jgi:peptide/nickel transport system permease protein
MSVLVFAVVRLVPGDAVDVMSDRMTPEQQERVRAAYGVDQPILVQYGLWLGRVLEGDFGQSLRSGRPVATEIGDVLLPTIELGIMAALIGIAIGLPVGIAAAIHQDQALDRGLRVFVYVGISLPEFWLGTLLIIAFAIGLGLFPVSGYVSVFDDPLGGLHSTFLPAMALGLIMAGFLSRVVRSTMLEVLRQDYMTVAKAKGLPARRVLYRHALKNAAPAIVTVIGLQFAFLISGAIIIEEVFVRPGLGRLLVRSIFQRDYAVVQGITLLFTTIFITANLATDIARAMLDPRLRTGAESGR